MQRICPSCEYTGEEKECPHDHHPMVSTDEYLEEEAQALIGRVFEERYEILSLLGKGGMGWVFLAKHMKTGQEVALKVLRKAAESKLGRVKRFFKEAQMSSRLRHPHTVRVFDYGASDDGYFFIAMEYLPGQSLAQLIANSATLSPRLVARIAHQICLALGEAHELGLVHRDLKPDNIFLSEVHGKDLHVKVLDFGIAKAIDAPEDDALTPLTATGATVGTPMYMSPEQASLQDMDGRTDLYSLGVMMYEMLTGDVPFAGKSAVAVMLAHVNKIPAPIPEEIAGNEIPESLRFLISELMAKKARDRPESAGAVAERLGEYARGDGPIAPSPLARQAFVPTVGPIATPGTTDSVTVPTALGEPTPPGRADRRSHGWWLIVGVVLIAGAIYGVSRMIQASPTASPTVTQADTVQPKRGETITVPTPTPESPPPKPAASKPDVSEPPLVPVDEDVVTPKPAATGKRVYRKRVQRQLRRVKKCALQHLKNTPAGTKLTLNMTFVIKPTGEVQEVNLKKRPELNRRFLACAKSLLRKVSFPAAPIQVKLTMKGNLVIVGAPKKP